MVEIFQNIRKAYEFAQPCEELAPYIEFYSQSAASPVIQKGDRDILTVKMFPSWTPTCYINLGAAYYVDLKNKRYYVDANSDVLLLRNEDVTRHILPADNIFTVKFNPGGLEAILDHSQISLVNKLVDLNNVLPAWLLRNIKHNIGFIERVSLIESYLLAAFNKQAKQDHYIKMVYDCIGEYRGKDQQLNTSEIAERQFITSKTINRYFKRVIGINPKSYFSILRARTALTAFINDRDRFAPLNYGYYDLSHFHKDMVSFTGKKLSDQ